MKENFIWHDEESCECLLCHGFYAATLDGDRFRQMIEINPVGALAVRTGRASRLIVIDAEAHADPKSDDGLTGLDVIDDWTGWTGIELPPTLHQRTSGGGLHIVYRLPVQDDGDVVTIYGHPRILPQVDIKGEAGYIVVADGTDPKRHWIHRIDALCDVTLDLLEWIQNRKGKSSSGHGGDGVRGTLLTSEEFREAYDNGAKAGVREPFFAMLSFTLRKRGVSEREIVQTMRHHWEQCEQPENDYFHWSFVEYKIDRDRSVQPDRIAPSLQEWASNLAKHVDGGIRKVGRVTLAPRR
jgi:hypothetical protein